MRTAVYKITNSVNGKLYIGLSANPTKRWWEHRNRTKKTHTKLYNVFRKYGVEAFSFEVLHWCNSQEDARDLENLVVDVCEVVTKGYNMCPGGGGGIAGPDNPFYGKPLSPEVRAKMSIAAQNRAPNPEARERAAAKMRGRKQSPEWIEKRASKKRGVTFTEEHKAKLSAARRNRAPASVETRAKLSASMKAYRAQQREAK